MRCPKGEDLAAYIDGELGEARTKQIASHLSACPGCTATAKDLQAVRNVLLNQPRPEPEASFARRTVDRMAAHSPVRELRPALPRKALVWVVAALLTLCIGSACLIVRPPGGVDDPLLARCVERFEQGAEQEDAALSIERCTSPWDAVLGEDMP